MTLYEEPPLVDLTEILDETEPHTQGTTALQWTLIVVGGLVGVAGMLTLLVLTAPALLELVSWIGSIWKSAGTV